MNYTQTNTGWTYFKTDKDLREVLSKLLPITSAEKEKNAKAINLENKKYEVFLKYKPKAEYIQKVLDSETEKELEDVIQEIVLANFNVSSKEIIDWKKELEKSALDEMSRLINTAASFSPHFGDVHSAQDTIKPTENTREQEEPKDLASQKHNTVVGLVGQIFTPIDSFRIKYDPDRHLIKSQGVKETTGKITYEFDWEFIEAAAKRMAKNKDKYPPYNWKKSIDIEDIKQAINRHHIEVMKGNYKDGDDELGHIESYLCNSMMLWHQLKNYPQGLEIKK
jgi:hypothetical protein